VVSRNEYMAGSLLSAISKAGRYDQGGLGKRLCQARET